MKPRRTPEFDRSACIRVTISEMRLAALGLLTLVQNRTGTKAGLPWLGATVVVVFDRPGPLCFENLTTQRRTIFAFRAFASAIAAIETPGSRDKLR